MNNKLQNHQIVFSAGVEDIQEEAQRLIGRELTEDELYTAAKCVHTGFSTVQLITFRAAIQEALGNNQ